MGLTGPRFFKEQKLYWGRLPTRHWGEPPTPHWGESPSPYQGEPHTPHWGEPSTPHWDEPPTPHWGEPPTPHWSEPPTPHWGEPPTWHCFFSWRICYSKRGSKEIQVYSIFLDFNIIIFSHINLEVIKNLIRRLAGLYMCV